MPSACLGGTTVRRCDGDLLHVIHECLTLLAEWLGKKLASV